MAAMNQPTKLPTALNTVDRMADWIEGQNELNGRVANGMQAIALTTDRFDEDFALVNEQLSAVRARMSDISLRLDVLERAGQYTGRNDG